VLPGKVTVVSVPSVGYGKGPKGRARAVQVAAVGVILEIGDGIVIKCGEDKHTRAPATGQGVGTAVALQPVVAVSNRVCPGIGLVPRMFPLVSHLGRGPFCFAELPPSARPEGRTV